MKNVILPLVVALAASMLHGTEANQYTVGGDLGWTILPGGAKTYASWASNLTLNFHNDSLFFNFQLGEHDITIVTENFHSCNTKNPMYHFKNPAAIVASCLGTFYFTCSCARHCHKGQKVAIRFAACSTGSFNASTSPRPSASTEEVTIKPLKITMLP